jgi:hypothetical protein
MLRPRTVLVVLALCTFPLAALTACSSSSPSSPASAAGSKTSNSGSSSAVKRPTDMCALLSTSEASTAMDTSISTTYKSESGCNYAGEDLNFATELAPTEIGSFATELSLLKLDIGKTSPIAGVADEAAGNANGLAFREGSVIIDIQTDPGTTSTTEAEMIAAAKVMIGHLG